MASLVIDSTRLSDIGGLFLITSSSEALTSFHPLLFIILYQYYNIYIFIELKKREKKKKKKERRGFEKSNYNTII